MKFQKTSIIIGARHATEDRDRRDSPTNTEDSLLGSSRNSSDSIGKQCQGSARITQKFGFWSLLTFGMVALSWGVFSLVYTPFQTLMDFRIKMTPGLPPFDWWQNPPDEVLMRVYIFNITNSDEFLNGTDPKLKVKEIGPIIYREKIYHRNPVFNDNGTLSYTSNRTAIFLPEMNTISLNETIVVPNLPVLLIPAYFYDASMIVKLGINIMLRTYKAQPIVKTTIKDFLWNFSDPILEPAQKVAPSLVPTKNVGILENIYKNFEDNVTVFIGAKWGDKKFFTIDKYDGKTHLPRFEKCDNQFVNATEGVCYAQYLTKNDTVYYWRKSLCKLGPLKFAYEENLYGVKSYKYVLESSMYDRVQPVDKDCYQGQGDPLPNGLADISSCYFGFPIAASFPHYLHGDDNIRSYVEGISPNEKDHESYIIVEPYTGIPLQGKARSQINLVIKKFRGFSGKIARFSDMVLPLVWIEYHQVGIPWYVHFLMYFVVNVVHKGQVAFSVCLLSLSFLAFYLTWFKWIRRRRKQLLRNKMLSFEQEKFVKR